jgi:DNA-binding GntR family transcriptional regulator
LRDAILIGSLQPGERLVEEDISQGMHTSRGPLREALRQLEQEGLVVSFPYRGSFVTHISTVELREVLVPIRATLEGFGFAQAIDNLTEGDFAQLDGVVAHMEGAVRAGDIVSLVEDDVAFHGLVMSRCGQPHATQLWGTIAPRMRAYFYTHRRDLTPSMEQMEKIPEKHRALCDALLVGDRIRITALVIDHVHGGPGLQEPSAVP